MVNKAVIATVAVLVVGAALTASASKLQNISSKFSGSAGLPGNVSLKGGMISMNMPIFLRNESAVALTLTNLYVKLQNRDSNGEWRNLFTQPKAIKEVKIPSYQTSKLATIPMEASYLDGIQIVNMLSGKQDRTLKVSVRFDVVGVEIKPLEFTIDASTYLAPIKKLLNLSGLGYAKNSFHHRELKPLPSKFEGLVTPAKGKESWMANDAIPEQTAERMAQIVKETLYQTKKLAPVIKGSSLNKTCENVYNYLYNYHQYKRDAENREQLREPAASFAERITGIDCDCFAIYCSSILSNLNINHAIKVISLRSDKALQHVYVIVPKDGKTIGGAGTYYTIDACLHSYDEEAQGITKEIFKTMITTRLSGFDDSLSSSLDTSEPLPIDGLEGYLAAVARAKASPTPKKAMSAVAKAAHSKLMVSKPAVMQTVITRNPAIVKSPSTAVNPSGKLVSAKPCACTKVAGKPCKCKEPVRSIPNPNVSVSSGTGKKKIRPYKESEIAAMQTVALEPVKKMLEDNLQQANSNPASLAPLYDVPSFKKAVSTLLDNWHDPIKRDSLLTAFEKQDEKIINKAGLTKRSLVFAGLGSAYIDPVFSYPLMGLDANDEIQIQGLGGFFSSIKKAAKAVGGAVKKAATTAVKTVATAAVKTGAVVKKAAVAVGTGVKNAAVFVKNNIQKINPVMIVARTAFRALVALNFRGWASTMSKMIANKQEGALKSKWTGALIGGNWGDLVASINSGAKKSALLKGLGNLGEPVTVASSVAAATPIIKIITDLLKTGADIKQSVDIIKGGSSSASNPASHTEQAVEQSNAMQAETSVNVGPSDSSSNSKTGLIIGGILAAAILAYVASSGTSRNAKISGAEVKKKTIKTVKI